jgi:hypothetical protein
MEEGLDSSYISFDWHGDSNFAGCC